MLDYEPILRLSIFAGTLAVMALLETLLPRRRRRCDRLLRWPANFAITLLNTLLLRLLFPTAAVGFALLCAERNIGLVNQLQLNGTAAVISCMVLLDLVIYAQHIVFHRVPLLWRIHRVHHTDLDLDVTTGARFHPLEILLSMLIKFGVIALIGAPAVAVLWFEILLNAGAMFNHANLRIPEWLDRRLRTVIVTPDMHRVHHSVRPTETDSNFGFNLSIWDRLFGSYNSQPVDGHTGMTIGLSEYQDIAVQRIDRMLALPFQDKQRNNQRRTP